MAHWLTSLSASERVVPSRQWRACFVVALSAWLGPAQTAHASDSSEFWPEANLFVALGPQTRLFLDAPNAKGKESNQSTLDLAVYLDISLKPIKKELQTEDWQ